MEKNDEGLGLEAGSPKDRGKAGRGAFPHKANVTTEECARRNGHQGLTIWLTGISGSGKSTVGRRLERRLWEQGMQTMLLDGDDLRVGLCSDLGFSDEDRRENIRRAAETAVLFHSRAFIVVCTFISPFERDRAFARTLFPKNRFIEVHVDCRLETAMGRDPKGLYLKAKEGQIRDFTGFQSSYERPANPDIRVDTETMDPDTAVETIWKSLPADLRL